jgi:ribosome-binding protein aMBF1 (putative translation factor)
VGEIVDSASTSHLSPQATYRRETSSATSSLNRTQELGGSIPPSSIAEKPCTSQTSLFAGFRTASESGRPSDPRTRGHRPARPERRCPTTHSGGRQLRRTDGHLMAADIARCFAGNLLRTRGHADSSQEELRFRAAIHRTEISSLERGMRVPRIDTVIKLSASLSISPCGSAGGNGVDTRRGQPRLLPDSSGRGKGLPQCQSGKRRLIRFSCRRCSIRCAERICGAASSIGVGGESRRARSDGHQSSSEGRRRAGRRGRRGSRGGSGRARDSRSRCTRSAPP